MKYYLATRYSCRLELCGYRADLTGLGIEVTSRWLNGSHQLDDKAVPITDEGDRRFEAGDPAVDHLRAHFAAEEMADVMAAETFVVSAGCRRLSPRPLDRLPCLDRGPGGPRRLRRGDDPPEAFGSFPRRRRRGRRRGAKFGLGLYGHRLFETSFAIAPPHHPRHHGSATGNPARLSPSPGTARPSPRPAPRWGS